MPRTPGGVSHRGSTETLSGPFQSKRCRWVAAANAVSPPNGKTAASRHFEFASWRLVAQSKFSGVVIADRSQCQAPHLSHTTTLSHWTRHRRARIREATASTRAAVVPTMRVVSIAATDPPSIHTSAPR